MNGAKAGANKSDGQSKLLVSVSVCVAVKQWINGPVWIQQAKVMRTEGRFVSTRSEKDIQKRTNREAVRILLSLEQKKHLTR